MIKAVIGFWFKYYFLPIFASGTLLGLVLGMFGTAGAVIMGVMIISSIPYWIIIFSQKCKRGLSWKEIAPYYVKWFLKGPFAYKDAFRLKKGTTHSQKRVSGDVVRCYSFEKGLQYVDLIVDETTVLYNDKVIGSYATVVQDKNAEKKEEKVIVTVDNIQIECYIDNFTTFYNKTRTEWLKKNVETIYGYMLTDKRVRADDEHIYTMSGIRLTDHNGCIEKGAAAFVCAHMLFFDDEFTEFFKKIDL